MLLLQYVLITVSSSAAFNIKNNFLKDSFLLAMFIVFRDTEIFLETSFINAFIEKFTLESLHVKVTLTRGYKFINI